MKILAKLVRLVDNFNDTIGRGVAWLTLVMVLVTFSVVVFRYVFSLGWVWMLESYVWLHGIVFMLGAGYTLLHNGHVRVDIFYREFSDKRKAFVDLVGHCLFLQPVCWAIFLFSWGFVEFSWRVMEVSAEPEGLPFVYMQKSLLIALCVFLALQSFSEILKNILRIKNG